MHGGNSQNSALASLPSTTHPVTWSEIAARVYTYVRTYMYILRVHCGGIPYLLLFLFVMRDYPVSTYVVVLWWLVMRYMQLVYIPRYVCSSIKIIFFCIMLCNKEKGVHEVPRM